MGERSVDVTVQDNGPGVSDSLLPRLGEPFQTTKVMPFSGLVYVQYKDKQGNISQTYSDTNYPPAGIVAE